MHQSPPRRIVCLTEETVETLYLLGEQDRIVGVSGYAVRPPRVRREKPRVSAFTSADIPKILALEPDLVLAFSDLQADDRRRPRPRGRRHPCLQSARRRRHPGDDPHARRAGRCGRTRRSTRRLASTAPRSDRGDAAARAKPKVYFEEWDDPLISGIGWVSELIEIAGGEDVLPKLRFQQAAKDRIISPDVVTRRRARRDPSLLVRQEGRAGPDQAAARLERIPAVRNNRIVEIKSPLILQPGPAALTDGLDAIVEALWPQ